MKKVALLTFHDTTNFGALLQMFGLYNTINKLGYECNILNYSNENIIRTEIPSSFHFSINPRDLVKEIIIKSKVRKKYRDMAAFFKRYVSHVTQPYNREELFHIKEKFDAFVAGSDMLWALDKTGNDYSYFLDFVPNDCVRFSYGTSIGKEWTHEQLCYIKQYLSRFSYISVREDIIAERLKSCLSINCDVVCDPTMLMTVEEWRKFISNRFKNKKYVLVYFNSEGNKNLRDAHIYARKKGLEVYYIGAGFSFKKGEKRVFPTRVEDFLSLLFYADTIFTASYHGMLFGLYFNKQLVYYNRHPSYRMQSVARRLGVESLEGTRLDVDAGLPIVNYAEVNAKLDKFRKYSTSRLIEALS